MACLASKTWPYVSTCQKLLEDGNPCNSDYECDIISGCWYATPADSVNNLKICIPKYQAANGKIFGYQPKVDLNFKYAIQENYILGKFCQSGIVFIDKKSNSMMCTSIKSVYTSDDNFQKA
jgi:hypothetical protein